MEDFGDLILGVEAENDGFGTGGLFAGHEGKGEDDQPIADFSFSGRSAVQANFSAPGFAGDCVGFKPFPVFDVRDEDLFEGQDFRLLHQARIDGEAAVVIELGIRHTRHVEFAFQHDEVHGFILPFAEVS